jgi:hypothetical protein
MLHPIAIERLRIVMAEIAGFGPEIVEIFGVGLQHSAIERGEAVNAHRAIAEP